MLTYLLKLNAMLRIVTDSEYLITKSLRGFDFNIFINCFIEVNLLMKSMK